MGKGNSKRKSKANSKPAEEDWLTALVQQTVVVDQTSKEERIAKRAAKRQRREERRGGGRDTKQKLQSQSKENPQQQKLAVRQVLLERIAELLRERTESVVVSNKIKNRPFEFSPLIKARNRKKALTDTMQPRKRDYGGQGLARESLFLDFSDPSLLRKLEEEFQEHVPGFFGKQRTKAMKKQHRGKMIWSQLCDKRLEHKRIGGKLVKDMSPDEKVEAMMKAGMI